MVSDFGELYVEEEVAVVLILLLMEYGLGHTIAISITDHFMTCLNPSFNGIWSRTFVSSVCMRVVASWS